MPPSSATMVGKAGATRVRLSEAMRDPSISPAKTARTARSTPFFSGAVVESRATTAVIPSGSPRAADDGTPPRPGLASPGSAQPDPPVTAGTSSGGDACGYLLAGQSPAGSRLVSG